MKEKMKELMAGSKAFAEYCPEAAQKFNDFSATALQPGSIDAKTKELICLGMGIISHCAHCIGAHTMKCYKAGASTQELMEVGALALYMGGGPSKAYIAELKKAIDLFEGQQS